MAKKSKKIKTTPAPEPHAYLMWIGSDSYEKIGDWIDEAIRLGVSKRLPNVHVARQLLVPGTIIYLAHDEGERHACPKCPGVIECPDCRKRINEMTDLRAQVRKMRDAFDDFEAEANQGQRRFVEIRESKIETFEVACQECFSCSGKGKIHSGTGGSVVLTNGLKWDYRTYNYWLHQPKKFAAADKVKSIAMCPFCGGTGTVPEGKIFGCFAPARIEYIATSPDDPGVGDGIGIVSPATLKAEPHRLCGRRHAGGVYAVTDPGVTSAVEAKMAAAGREVSVHGDFVQFLKPFAIPGEKRFRGMKRIDPEWVERCAEDVAAE